MANIVVAFYNPLMRIDGIFPYIESFLCNLKNYGNNILCFQKPATDLHIKQEIPERYLQKIKEFNPDLFILFNNQFFDISKHFDKPIIIFDIDSPNFWANLDSLKGDKRFRYLTGQTSSVSLIKNILGTNDIQVEYIRPFTNVQAKNVKIENNIAFCGSHWLFSGFTNIESFLAKNPTKKERDFARKVYNSIQVNPNNSVKSIYKKYNFSSANKLEIGDNFVFSTRISGLKRLRTLLAVADLDLEVRGFMWDSRNFSPLKAFPEVLLSYSNIPIRNLKDTENFYNSAKIGLNTNHIQAQTGFSWRVADILASNACLVTEKAKDLKNFNIKIPQFESPAEARELCQFILKNENYRKDIVLSAQDTIERNFRFSSILPTIEKLAEMKLAFKNKGSLEIISLDSLNKNYSKKEQYNSNLKLKDKIRYKIWRHYDKILKKKNII